MGAVFCVAVLYTGLSSSGFYWTDGEQNDGEQNEEEEEEEEEEHRRYEREIDLMTKHDDKAGKTPAMKRYTLQQQQTCPVQASLQEVVAQWAELRKLMLMWNKKYENR